VFKRRKSTYAMSRRRQKSLIVLFILLAGLLIWFDHNRSSDKPYHQLQSARPTQSHDIAKYHAKTFTVIKVIDGDTIDINIPDAKSNHTRIRLWGVDTPETKSPTASVMYYGLQAAQFTSKLTLGKQVTIYLDKENRTRGYYGRLLAYVQLPDGRFLNEVLLSEGFAYADLRFKHSFYNKYQQLEAAARKAPKGLWTNVTPQQLPKWLRDKKPKLLLGK